MAISCIQNFLPTLSDNTKTRLLVVTTALVVAGAVCVVWGKVAAVIFTGALFITYIQLGPVIRVFNFLDLKGIGLAVAAIASLILGGPLGWIACFSLACSILSREWQLYQVRVIIEKNNEALTKEINQTKEQTKKLESTLDTIIAKSGELSAFIQTSDQSFHELEQQETDCSSGFNKMHDQLKKIHHFLGDIQNDQWLQDQLATYTKISADICQLEEKRAELENNIAQMNDAILSSTQKTQELNNSFEETLSQLQAEKDRLRNL